MSIIYKYKIGEKVEWTNSNGVELGERTIIGLDVRTNRPTYYIDPIDTPWFSVNEEELKSINSRCKIKTYSQWSESRKDLSEFLQIGDIVDEEIVDFCLNVLPPKTWNNSIIQIGEAVDFVEGKQTYSTLKNTSDGWIWAGTCHKGQTENKVNELNYTF